MAEVKHTTRKIDYDKGVIIKQNAKLGMDVYMYVNEPGVYLSAHAIEVGDELAAEAGYDIAALAKEKQRNERRAAALDAIDKEFREEVASNPEIVVKEEGGLRIVDIGMGRHFVKDEEGQKLHDKSLTIEEAQRTMASILKAKKR